MRLNIEALTSEDCQDIIDTAKNSVYHAHTAMRKMLTGIAEQQQDDELAAFNAELPTPEQLQNVVPDNTVQEAAIRNAKLYESRSVGCCDGDCCQQ